MPYTHKKQGGKYVVYKKDTGERVGATAGNEEALKKYLAALHMHADENKQVEMKYIKTFEQFINESASDESESQEKIEKELQSNIIKKISELRESINAYKEFEAIEKNTIKSHHDTENNIINGLNKNIEEMEKLISDLNSLERNEK